jgi:outer membrane protein TolC
MAIKICNFLKNNSLKSKKIALIMLFSALILQAGCNSESKYRTKMNEKMDKIIADKQVQAVGKKSPFSLERPSDILRRRLLEGQNLPIHGPESLGSDKLKKIEHWPEKNYPIATFGGNVAEINEVNKPLTLSLVKALEIGARNSFDYQDQKELVFQSALSLELERNAFRYTFIGQVQNLLSTDTTSGRAESGTVNSFSAGANKKFENGAQISTNLAIDLANLFTLGGASSLGVAGDASISIPLLRGSGRHIVTEPLTQAERNVIYAIWNFERFKKQFAVNTATNYLTVLQQFDIIKNNAADYRSRIVGANRNKRLADAGRIQQIELDQAIQDELRSRQGWISSIQSYKKQLDSFKTFLGLPPDAAIELDPNELEYLLEPTNKIINDIDEEAKNAQADIELEAPEANAMIELVEPDYKNAGPYEIKEPNAIQLAFNNRLDLKVADGQVYDSQRAAIVAADLLGAELTFLGSVSIGDRRDTVGSASSLDARLRSDRGVSSTLLTLNLPFERTKESINYRNSLIKLEQTVRTVQKLEDSIKTDIRNTLRDLLLARENMYIQAKAVYVAEKRVKSTNMFLEAGRASTRDLLEAQDALLAAQNALTDAVVKYRIAELNIQLNMDTLQIDVKGLWQEYIPGESQNDEEKNISG